MVMLEDGLDVAHHPSNPSSRPGAWYVQEKEAYGDPRLRPYNNLADIPIGRVIDITTFVENKRAKTVLSELKSIPEVSVRTIPVRRYPDWTEVTLGYQFADKGSGLMSLKDRFPGRWATIVAFGDEINDLPLFESSDYAVAVANAAQEVKAAADSLTGSNINHGVLEWISKFSI